MKTFRKKIRLYVEIEKDILSAFKIKFIYKEEGKNMRLFLQLFLILGVLFFGMNGCSSSEKSMEENMEKIEPAPPPPAPGTADVDAEVISVEETENGTKCKIRITKVHGYGHSTPHISRDTEHELMLSRYLMSKNTKIESGKSYRMLLENSAGKGEEANSNWLISSVK